MDANKYFQIMKETGKYTYSTIDKYISEDLKEDDLKDFIKKFTEGRLQNKRRLRSMLTRAVYHVLTNDKNEEGWKKGKNLYSFAELWCISDYLSNDTFDNKFEKCKIETFKDSNLSFIASAVTRELSQKALQNAFNDFSTPLETKVKTLENFSELVKDAYLHQWIDYTSKYNGQSIEWFKGNLEKLFKKRYLDYQAGNVFGKILEIACLTIKPKKERERELLSEYGNSSSKLQLINDLADIAENCYDAKNKLLTYPLILTMIKTGKNVYELPSSEIRELFVRSGAFKETKKRAIEMMKKANKPLKELNNIVGENIGIDLLNSFLIMAKSNKYYKILRAYENDK